MIRRVKVIVESLGRKRVEEMPYCSEEIRWQINKLYLKRNDKVQLRQALRANVTENDRIEHLRYSAQALERNICVVCGSFRVVNGVDSGAGYGFGYEITVILRNALAERVILHGSRDEPTVWVIRSDEDHIYNLTESEVIYIESSHNDLIWHCRDIAIRGRGTLKALEKCMPSHFLRLQRGYIINTNHIRKMERRDVVMDNQDILPIPHRNSGQIKRKIRNCLTKGERNGNCREHIGKKSLL